jgi:hypothetical protein
MRLPPGTIKRLHVNQHALRRKRRTGEDLPVCTVQTSKGPHRGREVRLWRDGEVVATFRELPTPLKCGARVVVETTCEVEVLP